jgi:hypothetical protein
MSSPFRRKGNPSMRSRLILMLAACLVVVLLVEPCWAGIRRGRGRAMRSGGSAGRAGGAARMMGGASVGGTSAPTAQRMMSSARGPAGKSAGAASSGMAGSKGSGASKKSSTSSKNSRKGRSSTTLSGSQAADSQTPLTAGSTSSSGGQSSHQLTREGSGIEVLRPPVRP